MTIYLDVVWLLNFGIDAFLLTLTGFILKRKIKIRRIVIAAFLGSTIVLLYFTPVAPIALHPITKLFYSVCMVIITFGFKRFRFFVRSLFTFYFVTFLLGGGLIGIHFFLQTSATWANGTLITNANGFGDPISWLFLLIGFPVLWFFSKKQIEELEVTKIHYDQMVPVKIKISDIELSLLGLIDSGNQLQDPISKLPVMIVDVTKCPDKFPDTIVNYADNLDGIAETNNQDLLHRLRMIPYRGVGQDHQFLIALKPDLISIQMNNETIHTKKALVGLTKTPLSSDGEYECIVHPRMISGNNAQTA